MRKFKFSISTSYCSWGYPGTDCDYCTKTKIWAVIPKAAWKAINRAEDQSNGWVAPEIIYEEGVRGEYPSETAWTIIHALDAEEEEEEQ